MQTSLAGRVRSNEMAADVRGAVMTDDLKGASDVLFEA